MRWRGDYFRINVKKWNFMDLNELLFMLVILTEIEIKAIMIMMMMSFVISACYLLLVLVFELFVSLKIRLAKFFASKVRSITYLYQECVQ